jgi:hypothetical protein
LFMGGSYVSTNYLLNKNLKTQSYYTMPSGGKICS